MHEDAFDGKVNHKYLIEEDPIVDFIQLSTNDKGGFDNSVFCSQIDSEKLKVTDNNDYVTIWRA